MVSTARTLSRALRGSAAVTTALLATFVALAPAAAAAAPVTARLTVGPTSQVRPAGTRYTLGGYLTADGRPVAGDFVTVFRSVDGRLDRLGAARTRANGSWAYAGTTPGSIVLRVMSSAHDGVSAAWAGPATVHIRSDPLGSRAVHDAAELAGSPYEYGGAGPRDFDCSGLTAYVFGELGHSLPHNAASQYDVVAHVAQQDVQPGDLIFFTGSGGVYHVGIYAGSGEIWHAPRPGEGVRENPIWTSSYLV
ncbi:MAG: C40 family peptidase, partial [Mycobacteriales bacterium]